MEFTDLKDLTAKINNKLGGFCNKFQYKRKELLNLNKIAKKGVLFEYKKKDRDWSINKGGGTELQYHLFFRNNQIGYGLGFNTQYVPFATNKKSPADYIRPYVKSFLSQPNLEKELFDKGFSYLIGERNQLENLRDKNYVLIGKVIPVEQKGNLYIVNDKKFAELLNDIKGILFQTYIKVLSQIKKSEYIMNTINKFVEILEYKHQIILQGAPGTGKTYLSQIIAKKLTDNNSDFFKIIQFHPAYSYEDFVRGIITETTEDGQVVYLIQNKILAEFADKAINNPKANYVLIIDEINRANLPAVLGELIYALEYRGKPVESMYEYENSREIILPENLYIIGTMNTADRSVGNIDYAIRRRFAFITLLSDKTVVENYYENDDLRNYATNLYEKVESLFNENNLSPDYKKDDIMIGHSYFLANNEENLKIKLEYEIKPILLEYVKDGIFIADDIEQKIKEL